MPGQQNRVPGIAKERGFYREQVAPSRLLHQQRGPQRPHYSDSNEYENLKNQPINGYFAKKGVAKQTHHPRR
jgi:hypothetical protein